MIIGIGHDLVDQRRIKRLIDNFGTKFVHRICTKEEIQEFQSYKDKIRYLSGRFAVKESVYKALSKYERSKMGWHNVSTLRYKTGAPILYLNGVALAEAEVFVPKGCCLDAFVSITDQPPYSSAMVVFSYKVKHINT